VNPGGLQAEMIGYHPFTPGFRVALQVALAFTIVVSLSFPAVLSGWSFLCCIAILMFPLLWVKSRGQASVSSKSLVSWLDGTLYPILVYLKTYITPLKFFVEASS